VLLSMIVLLGMVMALLIVVSLGLRLGIGVLLEKREHLRRAQKTTHIIVPLRARYLVTSWCHRELHTGCISRIAISCAL